MNKLTTWWRNLKHSIADKVEFSYQVKQKNQIFIGLAAMLRAGIDVITALESLKRERNSRYETKIIDGMHTDLKNGMPIWRVFKKYGMVPDQLIALIRTGEKSGSLPQNIQGVQNQMRKNKQFTSKIRSASLYPGFVLVLLIIVTIVVVAFVLPRLSSVYSSFGSDLPWYTQLMINIGNFMQQYGLIAVPVFIIFFIALIYFVFFHKSTKYIGEKILFNTPVINRIIVELQVSRMGQMLANLTSGGISIDEALQLLAETTDHHIYRKFYLDLREELLAGHSINTGLRSISNSQKILPLIAQQIIISGEQTGELSESFRSVANEFEQRSETSAKDFGTVIEPVLIVIVWIGVGLVAFSVIIPLYSIVGNFDDLDTTTNNNNDQSVSNTIEFGNTDYRSGKSIDELLTGSSNSAENDQTNTSIDGEVQGANTSKQSTTNSQASGGVVVK